MRLSLFLLAVYFQLAASATGLDYRMTIHRTVPGADIAFAGEAGAEHTLETTDNLDNPFWSPLISVVLTNNSFTWREPASFLRDNRYYRARQSDPEEMRYADNFRLIDHQGKSRELFYYYPNTNLTAFVLIFAQDNYTSFASKITALKNTPRFQNKVLFFTIDTTISPSRSSISNLAVAAGISWPVFPDPEQMVTRSYDARFSGEVVVVSRADLQIAYRGLIDDGTNTFLANALDKIAAANRVMVTRMQSRQGGIARMPRTQVDYAQVIAPILQRKCVSCHTPGSIGPFTMTNYNELLPHSMMMKEMVMTGMMPPFHADPLFGRWQNNSALTIAEKAQLIDWIDAGMPRGNGPDPLTNVPPPPAKWPVELGPPDEIVTTEVQPVRAVGTEAYRYVYANATNSTPRWLRAAVVRPGNRAVVHHYIVFQGHSRDLQLAGIAFYVPGHNDRPFPAGTGMRIPANAPLTFNLHYTANGEETTDQPELALWYTNAPPARTLEMAAAYTIPFIPPNSFDQDVVATHSFTNAATVYSFSPHMHVRGLRMRFELSLPGVAGKQMLLSVPKYDFDWQTVYALETPLEVPANATITVTGAFDNTYLNRFNPDPTKFVIWGEQSWEEMFIGYIEYANR